MNVRMRPKETTLSVTSVFMNPLADMILLRKTAIQNLIFLWKHHKFSRIFKYFNQNKKPSEYDHIIFLLILKTS